MMTSDLLNMIINLLLAEIEFLGPDIDLVILFSWFKASIISCLQLGLPGLLYLIFLVRNQ